MGKSTTAKSEIRVEIYGVGVVAIFGILAAMYSHAYAQRGELGLTPLEIVDTRIEIYRNLALAALGPLSVAVAAITAVAAPRLGGIAGDIYFSIGFSEWGIGEYGGRLRRKLANTADTSPA